MGDNSYEGAQSNVMKSGCKIIRHHRSLSLSECQIIMINRRRGRNFIRQWQHNNIA